MRMREWSSCGVRFWRKVRRETMARGSMTLSRPAPRMPSAMVARAAMMIEMVRALGIWLMSEMDRVMRKEMMKTASDPSIDFWPALVW